MGIGSKTITRRNNRKEENSSLAKGEKGDWRENNIKVDRRQKMKSRLAFFCFFSHKPSERDKRVAGHKANVGSGGYEDARPFFGWSVPCQHSTTHNKTARASHRDTHTHTQVPFFSSSFGLSTHGHLAINNNCILISSQRLFCPPGE